MRTAIRTTLALLFIALLAEPAAAQSLWDRVKRSAQDAAERTVETKVTDKTVQVVGGAFDLAENAVMCVATDKACIEQAERDDKNVVLTDGDGGVYVDAKGNPISDPDGIPNEMKPGSGVPSSEANVNIDFQAGERTIFAEDFAGDNVGDFPRRLEFVRGNWEVVEWQDRRFLRTTSNRSSFKVPLPETLPDRFTIEFEASFLHGNQQLAVATAEPDGGRVRQFDGQNFFIVTNAKSGVDAGGNGVTALQRMDNPFTEQVVPVRIMVDGSYAKVYVGTQRVSNVPNAVLPRTNIVWFENTYNANEEHPIYIANLRIAAGGKDLYEALSTDGRVAVQDILFDTGKATIKSESGETLAEIAALLEEHTELRLLIEGHTDDTGDFEQNMTLSTERADAVWTYLVERHGVDAERLKAMGLGMTQPTASNDTDEGRAENRRVELVRL